MVLFRSRMEEMGGASSAFSLSASTSLDLRSVEGHGVRLGGGVTGAMKVAGSRTVRPGKRAKSAPLKVRSRVTPGFSWRQRAGRQKTRGRDRSG